MKKILFLTITLLCFCLAKAQIIYVTPTGAGDKSGSSWANATSSLTSAVELAQTRNASVWVAAGVYFGDTTSAQAFIVAPGVKVYGGFAGNEPVDYNLDLRDFEANETILDGDSSRRVLLQTVKDSTALWDGFTVRNGKTPFSFSSDYGAGAFVIGASLSNCKFTHNSVSAIFSQGGGVYVENSTISHCTIIHNKTMMDGAGIYALKSLVTDCDIAYNNSGVGCGGIEADSSIVKNCRIYNNYAGLSAGGAVCNYSVISNCEIFNNTTEKNNMAGPGGIICEYSTLTHSKIYNNISYGGGGVSLWSSTASNCLIHNNTMECIDTTNIYLGASGVKMTNSIIINSTITNNAGLKAIDIGTNTVIAPIDTTKNLIINSIIWGNRTLNDSTAPIVGEITDETVQYSLIDENFKGQGNIISTENPGFILPTEVIGADSTIQESDWRLEENSICINKGYNAIVTDSFDLAGNTRIQQEIVDMGCYEFVKEEDDPTGIKEYSNEVNIYPNPTSGLINITGTSFTEVQIYECNGKRIATHTSDGTSTTINMSSYAPSIYILRIIDNNQIRSIKKIIKK